ncbi:MAG TPA: vitamin K epoxide reductase family protein [Pyrinomonadaceae bacterium]|nr:vitamin K epoxide reductase family protein [Pyrinomonadaceae bacterium]
MNDVVVNAAPAEGASIAKLPVLGAIIALAGLVDAAYLTVHHLTAEPVPCNIVAGCETVLTSSYAQIGGIPLAAFGAAAYFIAFSLALLAAFGNRMMWTLFGVQVVLMSLFTLWLLYLQGYVIGAFCQFCLISAVTTFSMLGIFIASRFTR